MPKNTSHNLFDLNSIRKQAKEKMATNALDKYLGILSFSQLINETQNFMTQIEKNNISSQTIKKSQIYFKQLGNRLENGSQEYAKIVHQMKEHIEDKAKNLID